MVEHRPLRAWDGGPVAASASRWATLLCQAVERVRPSSTAGPATTPETKASYSARIATRGSTRAARNAGIAQAPSPTAAISSATARKVTGSRGGTPKSRP